MLHLQTQLLHYNVTSSPLVVRLVGGCLLVGLKWWMGKQ